MIPDILYVKQENGVLSFNSVYFYESRGVDSEKIIRDAIHKHCITKDFEFRLHLDDGIFNPEEADFSYATAHKDFEKAFPSCFYRGWAEVGLNDYSETCAELSKITTPPLKKDTLGWIGNCDTHQNRYILKEISEKNKNIECFDMKWNHNKAGLEMWKHTHNYMSMPQQLERWEFLIDIEGKGFSGRLPVLMSGSRLLFIADRPCEEWWFPYLKPWETHVPVKRDLSDLEENLNIIINNKELQNKILKGQREFADTYLTYDAQLDRIAYMINKL